MKSSGPSSFPCYCKNRKTAARQPQKDNRIARKSTGGPRPIKLEGFCLVCHGFVTREGEQQVSGSESDSEVQFVEKRDESDGKKGSSELKNKDPASTSTSISSAAAAPILPITGSLATSNGTVPPPPPLPVGFGNLKLEAVDMRNFYSAPSTPTNFGTPGGSTANSILPKFTDDTNECDPLLAKSPRISNLLNSPPPQKLAFSVAFKPLAGPIRPSMLEDFRRSLSYDLSRLAAKHFNHQLVTPVRPLLSGDGNLSNSLSPSQNTGELENHLSHQGTLKKLDYSEGSDASEGQLRKKKRHYPPPSATVTAPCSQSTSRANFIGVTDTENDAGEPGDCDRDSVVLRKKMPSVTVVPPASEISRDGLTEVFSNFQFIRSLLISSGACNSTKQYSQLNGVEQMLLSVCEKDKKKRKRARVREPAVEDNNIDQNQTEDEVDEASPSPRN